VAASGPICQVPTQVSGGTLATPGAGQTVIVSSAPRPRRVVVSEPRDNSQPTRNRGRYAWRQTDPEIATHTDGGLEDNAVTR
jgi:hypothetical protein